MITLDFETHAIEFGSGKSPAPVGLAYKYNDEPGVYLSWGHPTNNNSTVEEVSDLLHDCWGNHDALLFHNAKFDLAVAMEHFNLPYPHGRVHDTMFQAYLHDPREHSLSLKSLADKYINMPPDEQADLRAWLVANVPKATAKNFGAYIALAPADLVGRYAVGDVDRTYALHRFFCAKLFKEVGV